GNRANLAGDLGTNRMLLAEIVPGIRHELLEAEADTLLLLIDAEDDCLDHIADVQHLGRIANLLGPAHFGDVDQALDSFFELDEGAVIGEAHDLALDASADREALMDREPRIRLELLHT